MASAASYLTERPIIRGTRRATSHDILRVHTTDGSLFSPARAVGVAGALALTVDGTIFEPNDQNRKTFFAAFCFLVNEFRGRKTSASRNPSFTSLLSVHVVQLNSRRFPQGFARFSGKRFNPR